MILIADSGSTKTSWLLIDSKDVIQRIETAGYNPYYYKFEVLNNIIADELLPNISDKLIHEIYYYGSGCSSEINCTKVETALSQQFPDALIDINHDLTGAAAALLKDKEGIACILGTGSNSCYWDGESIIANVPSVGYLIGDEGSGTYIGMKILKGILEEKAPKDIIDKFYSYFNLSFEKILKSIYEKPEPNRFFASISKFAGDNRDNKWIYSQIKQSFNDFITNQVMHYPHYSEIEVCFTGSIAYYFQDILIEACLENNLKPGLILKEPILGLHEYHCM